MPAARAQFTAWALITLTALLMLTFSQPLPGVVCLMLAQYFPRLSRR